MLQNHQNKRICMKSNIAELENKERVEVSFTLLFLLFPQLPNNIIHQISITHQMQAIFRVLFALQCFLFLKFVYPFL